MTSARLSLLLLLLLLLVLVLPPALACGSREASPHAATLSEACAPPALDAVPRRLACTGLYEDRAMTKLATSVRPYRPAVELWSDGAEKSRFVALPPETTIDSANMDGWIFPDGTRFWKEFRLVGKRIETRLLWKRNGQWSYAVYRWLPDGSDAVLLTDGERNVEGTMYEVPRQDACERCHAGAADGALGFEAVGLGLPGATDLTLAILVSEGRLSQPPARSEMALPDDADGAPLALGWLHANCGTACHNRRAEAGASFTELYLRIDASQLLARARTAELDPVRTAVGAKMQWSPLAERFTYRIDPGSTERSGLFALATARSEAPKAQMPPLVSHIPDPLGTEHLRSWIAAMP